MDRRNFFKTAMLSGVSIASIRDMNAASTILQSSQMVDTTIVNDVVMLSGYEPRQLFRKAITQMGGMDKYITKGDIVCIKPNIGWNKAPEFGANTNPELVAAIVKQCYDAGAKEVVVFDHTIDSWKQCYANSGIEAAALDAGAKMIPSHQSAYYREVSLPNSKIINKVKIHEAILNADKWINVPVLKHHSGLGYSIAKKNYMGIVWDRNQILDSNDLSQSLEDICSFSKKPILNVVDAYRVITKRGPKGGSESDTVLAKTIFVSQNIDAIDKAATNFLKEL